MKPVVDLENISEEDLLATRICDLPLKIEGTWLQECITQLYQELEAKGIVFKPECYLADEWLTPEGETCIGIPFYLAQPVLTRLEKKIMIEAEGDTKEWCMKLLRHEAGHALEYAYSFHRRPKWRRIFGPASLEYADTYKFRPYSKNYVRHLDGYYAQYHPDEDFVETFAVWLTPGLGWRELYKGWKALAKLEYVDQLMSEIRGKAPTVKSKHKYWRLSSLQMTLRHFYNKKRHFWAEDFPDFHDAFLNRVFTPACLWRGSPANGEVRQGRPMAADGQVPKAVAAAVIRKYRYPLLKSVSKYSGERKHVINDLLGDIIKRSRELKLVVQDDETVVTMQLATYVTSLIMNYLYTGRFRGPFARSQNGG
ncbi:MAG: hypothetical protein A2705_03255 [Omnitrophica WOR_2 bacterium RIFCSPHIGHO2_01_FULL_52_10]|nr:MAG: hypothetical protein A2705_03255 [Omnitrophica WOR_2 bacterium RIFCSPHIGHO2_01_FULL_52_10]